MRPPRILHAAAPLRVAIVVRVSRVNYVNVVRDLVHTVDRFGHAGRVSLTLYLSLDDRALGRLPALGGDLARRFAAVHRVTDTDRRTMVEQAIAIADCPAPVAETLLLRRPYAYQLNSAIHAAILDGHRFALFFDDDQAFTSPVADGRGRLSWVAQDVLGQHLRCLRQGAAITVGRVTGWRLPLPPELAQRTSRPLRQRLGHLFDGGSEVLGRDTFVDPRPHFLCDGHGSASAVAPSPWITPANLGLDLQATLPAFYNPPGARGEDAFFSVAVDPRTAIGRLSAAVFHDPFLMHPEIYRGRFPSVLREPDGSADGLQRFTEALIGWARYLPLFVRLRYGNDRARYQLDLHRRLQAARAVIPALASGLDHPDVTGAVDALDEYDRRVERDRNDFLRVQEVWRRQVLPTLQRGTMTREDLPEPCGRRGVHDVSHARAGRSGGAVSTSALTRC